MIPKSESSLLSNVTYNDYNDIGGDFFAQLYENRPSKIAGVLCSVVLGPFIICMAYGIVWDHFNKEIYTHFVLQSPIS